MNISNDRRLFWACWIALITTAFGFIVRALILDEWARDFHLDQTQKGQIFGAGLWPFAISIVLFSFIIDRIGYGRAMVFAFICHVASAVIVICASLARPAAGASPEEIASASKQGYWLLYIGNLIVALGNGTVEAVINPVVATMFSHAKTKWLNILHAGWPGGLVLGGIIALLMGPQTDWTWKVGLILIPTVIYGAIMITCTFPPNERVAAGVPYKSMLQEAGILGALVVSLLIVFQVTLVLDQAGLIFQPAASTPVGCSAAGSAGTMALDQEGQVFQGTDENTKLMIKLGISVGITALFGLYVRSLGRPLFFFLLLIMIPLATTELGTDSWISSLMEPEMAKMALPGGLVLVYTSFIMMVLRFFAGPIVHKVSPLGLLAISAAIAALGLVSLSYATGALILAAATLYGLGKTFFWPTMLGVAAEQYPKGGALTLNTLGGVGMLAVGVIGSPFLGNIQDRITSSKLKENHLAVYNVVAAGEKESITGTYASIDTSKAKTEAQKKVIEETENVAKKNALLIVALFPCVMLVCYLLLILYFRSRGGYQAEVLTGHKAHDEEFTGGVEAAIEA